jgi:hypothetical protein
LWEDDGGLDACEVVVVTRAGEVFSDPEAPHVVQAVGVRVNGVVVPLPRGSRVQIGGLVGREGLAVTVTLLPSSLELEEE